MIFRGMSSIDIRDGFSYNAHKIQFILAWSMCKWLSKGVDKPRNMNGRQRWQPH